MPDLDAFEAEVKAKIKQLSAKDAATRRKAAAWLGEAGDPTAVTALAKAYKQDSDGRVRSAAAYSLGMFRKLEQELEGDDQEATMQLLQDVALEGKMGRRVPIPVRSIVKFEIGLLLSAAIVAALAFILPGVLSGGRGGGAAITGNDDAAAIAQLDAALTALTANVTRLQTQYQATLTGSSVNCEEVFNPTEAVSITTANADLQSIAASINAAQTSFKDAKAAYDTACEDNSGVIDPATNGANMLAIGTVAQEVATITTRFASFRSAPALPTIEVLPTEGETISPTPIPEATEAAPPTAQGAAEIRPHLVALQNIIDGVNARDGAYSLLNQYWTDVQTSGSSGGCSQPQPVIPEDYVLPEALNDSAPTLKLATGFVNTGLGLLRQGWTLFLTSCTGGTLTQNLPSGQVVVTGAGQSFNAAGGQIAGLRGSS